MGPLLKEPNSFIPSEKSHFPGCVMRMGKCSVTLARNVHKSQMILLVFSVDAPILKLTHWLSADNCRPVNFKPR